VIHRKASSISGAETINEQGEWVGGFLDVKGISDRCEVHTAVRLTEGEVAPLVSATRTTFYRSLHTLGKVDEELVRGENACFACYEPGDVE
jgi:hypothetical protein